MRTWLIPILLTACVPDGKTHQPMEADLGQAPLDAAPLDAAPLDAAPLDAAPLDAGFLDAGRPDADPIDAAPLDADPLDAAPLDAGFLDAAPLDADPIDADPLDAAPLDAGFLDAAPLDADPIDATRPDVSTGGCGIAGQTGRCVLPESCGGRLFLSECSAPTHCCIDTPDSPCSVDGAPGLCIDVASCGAGWVSTPGRCPGPANIRCCTEVGRSCDDTLMPSPNEGLVEEVWDAACPLGMVSVGTDFCIDRYEASLLELDASDNVVGSWSPYHHPGSVRARAVSWRGAVPQGYITGTEAAAACAEANKRLCTDTEWLRSCRGAASYIYPYGDQREDGRCNDARSSHPAIEYFGTGDSWIWSALGNACISQIPDAVHVTGYNAGCVSEDGAFDMMGNLHEWTSDSNGTFRGGFYADTVINGPGCLYATTAHSTGHWDYSTGFRCCADR